MQRLKTVRESGLTFLFKYDQVYPTILHIFARHLTTIDDALDVYFDSRPTGNDQFRRYENYTSTHGLYWFWRNEQKKEVFIISCFRI